MSIWFQPLLDRSGAQRYVGSLPVGSFVVRKSSQEGNYALTVNSSEYVAWLFLLFFFFFFFFFFFKRVLGVGSDFSTAVKRRI